jgi:hypothetical protein
MKDTSWRLPVGFFLGAIVITFAWATAEPGLCELADAIVKADDPNKTVADCIEFWANRYQTLFGVIVAIGASAAAWWGSFGQIKAMKEQLPWLRNQSAVTEADYWARRLAARQQVYSLAGILTETLSECRREAVNSYDAVGVTRDLHQRLRTHFSPDFCHTPPNLLELEGALSKFKSAIQRLKNARVEFEHALVDAHNPELQSQAQKVARLLQHAELFGHSLIGDLERYEQTYSSQSHILGPVLMLAARREIFELTYSDSQLSEFHDLARIAVAHAHAQLERSISKFISQ